MNSDKMTNRALLGSRVRRYVLLASDTQAAQATPARWLRISPHSHAHSRISPLSLRLQDSQPASCDPGARRFISCPRCGAGGAAFVTKGWSPRRPEAGRQSPWAAQEHERHGALLQQQGELLQAPLARRCYVARAGDESAEAHAVVIAGHDRAAIHSAFEESRFRTGSTGQYQRAGHARRRAWRAWRAQEPWRRHLGIVGERRRPWWRRASPHPSPRAQSCAAAHEPGRQGRIESHGSACVAAGETRRLNGCYI